jgi:hypothetical protein
MDFVQVYEIHFEWRVLDDGARGQDIASAKAGYSIERGA